jgi:hypothetical protein
MRSVPLLGPDDDVPSFFTLQPGGRVPARRHEQIEHQTEWLDHAEES